MKGRGYRDALGYHAQRKAPSNFEKPPLPNARTCAENQASATTAAPVSAAAALEEMETGRVGAMMMEERSGTDAKTNAAFYHSKAPPLHKTEAAARAATATTVTARAAAATNVRSHHHGRTMVVG